MRIFELRDKLRFRYVISEIGIRLRINYFVLLLIQLLVEPFHSLLNRSFSLTFGFIRTRRADD